MARDLPFSPALFLDDHLFKNGHVKSALLFRALAGRHVSLLGASVAYNGDSVPPSIGPLNGMDLRSSSCDGSMKTECINMLAA